jgi:uncharacterized protein YndB with AHSA1/START domain
MQRSVKRTGFAFRLKRRFEAPREKVFDAWTKPEALKQWWCPEGWIPAEIEVDLRVGGAFRIGMRRASGGTPVYVRGIFQEVHRPERLAYTWQWENAFEDMPQTRVTVQFTEAATATELLLTHENLPEIPICLQHRSGWIAACDRITHILNVVPRTDGVRTGFSH